jgi:hypothetical protein
MRVIRRTVRLTPSIERRKPLVERRQPLDETADTATDLLERELESGVKIENATRRRQSREDSVRSDLGGLIVTQEHIETRER